MAKGAIRIDWFPEAALTGMKFLKPIEELAYRRLLDLLYTEGGVLPNDDELLAEQTRTFGEWPKVKRVLIAKGKILADAYGISNLRATQQLMEMQRRINLSAAGGKTSAHRRQVLRLEYQEKMSSETSSTLASTLDGPLAKKRKKPSSETQVSQLVIEGSLEPSSIATVDVETGRPEITDFDPEMF